MTGRGGVQEAADSADAMREQLNGLLRACNIAYTKWLCLGSTHLPSWKTAGPRYCCPGPDPGGSGAWAILGLDMKSAQVS